MRADFCCRIALVAGMSIVCFSNAMSQEPAQAPSASDIVKRATDAAGGKEAFKRIQTITIKGTFAIPQANLNGTLTTQFAAPQRAKVTVDLGAVGKIEQVVLPQGGWESTPSTGVRKFSDQEAKRLLESIGMRTAYEPELVYEWMANKGMEEIEGQSCYHLEMKRPGETQPDHIYYSTDTGHPIKTITSRTTAAGTTRIVSTEAEYKEFDGIKVATKVTQIVESLGATHEIRIESLQINAGIDDSVFAAPEAVASK